MVSIGRRKLITLAGLALVPGALDACSSTSKTASNTSSGGTKNVTLTITANAIEGGKNAAEAKWVADWVIPQFQKANPGVTVKFEPQGVNDENYKTKIALDLKSGKGADIIAIDGIWTGEFAQAGYIKPLKDVAGAAVDAWDGWKQIPNAVQGAVSFQGKVYGVPQGTDGRVFFYNKNLFSKAGLPTAWQPTSWDDVLNAARALKKLKGVTPIQLNAGTAMGEATTMQGILPMLVGTGEYVWADNKWAGNTKGLRDVMNLYKTIYVDEKLGDPVLQQEANGRDSSFQEFAAGQIGILAEGDYFWRSVINPAKGVGTAPMADRDTVVGYTKIPAMKPGSGVKGQSFVSMSGGAGRVLNPNTKNADMAWKLMELICSPEGFAARAAGTLSISPRDDVNKTLLAKDPMLTYVSTEVLPITSYRPGLADYTQVSTALQQASLDVVTGTSVADALKTYTGTLGGIVGAGNITNN